MKLPRKTVLRGMLRKEFTQLFRDIKMRGIVFVAPVIMLLSAIIWPSVQTASPSLCSAA